MKHRKKESMIFILVILIMSITIGYAALTTNLSINGTGKISNASWDIHFENINVTPGSVTGDLVTKAATIDSATSVSYNVSLKNPGDFYEFTVDVKNSGTIDGMIDSVVSKLNGSAITTLPSYLEYYVTYADGMEIESNHKLNVGEKETYIIKFGYRNDINPSELPTTDQNYSMQFTANYTQKTDTAVTRDYYVFNIQGGNLNDSIDNIGTYYKNYREAEQNFNSTVFLRYRIQDGIITSADIMILLNGNIYYSTTPTTIPGCGCSPDSLISSLSCVAHSGAFGCTGNDLSVSGMNYSSTSKILEIRVTSQPSKKCTIMGSNSSGTTNCQFYCS